MKEKTVNAVVVGVVLVVGMAILTKVWSNDNEADRAKARYQRIIIERYPPVGAAEWSFKDPIFNGTVGVVRDAGTRFPIPESCDFGSLTFPRCFNDAYKHSNLVLVLDTDDDTMPCPEDTVKVRLEAGTIGYRKYYACMTEETQNDD